MEGSSIREFPRTLLNNLVEIIVEGKALRVQDEAGNLSGGGVGVHCRELPVGARVRVRIAGTQPFEAEGVIRHCDPEENGAVGIEFTSMSKAKHEQLDALIAELTRKGQPAC